jgi:hypothetical protein
MPPSMQSSPLTCVVWRVIANKVVAVFPAKLSTVQPMPCPTLSHHLIFSWPNISRPRYGLRTSSSSPPSSRLHRKRSHQAHPHPTTTQKAHNLTKSASYHWREGAAIITSLYNAIKRAIFRQADSIGSHSPRSHQSVCVQFSQESKKQKAYL